MTFDTSAAYDYTVIGGSQVLTASHPTPDEEGGYITLGKGGVRGWDEPPSVKADGTQNGRTLVLSGGIKAPQGRVQRDTLYDNLVGAIPMSAPEPVVFHRDGLVRHVRAVLGSVAPQKLISSPYKGGYSMQLYAADPRRLSGYGDGYDQKHYGDQGVPTWLIMENAGNGYVPPMELRFTDCTRPSVITSGSPTAALSVDVTVGAYQELYVDLENHKATLSDGTDVTHLVRGEWPLLTRSNNVFSFDADVIGAESLPSIWWYNSWI